MPFISFPSRLRRLVPPAGPQQLWVEPLQGGSAEACNAVWYREGSRGEEWNIRSVPHSRGVSPQSAPTSPEKCVADHFPWWWPQMWPGPHWSLGTLGLNDDDNDEHYACFSTLIYNRFLPLTTARICRGEKKNHILETFSFLNWRWIHFNICLSTRHFLPSHNNVKLS